MVRAHRVLRLLQNTELPPDADDEEQSLFREAPKPPPHAAGWAIKRRRLCATLDGFSLHAATWQDLTSTTFSRADTSVAEIAYAADPSNTALSNTRRGPVASYGHQHFRESDLEVIGPGDIMSSSAFPHSSLDDALSAARASGKFVVIDFTASWCAPCRAMDANVWPDPKVAAWIAAHAHGVKIDIDEQEAVASKFDIRAVPSVVVLKSSGEIADRFTGGRSAADLLEFFGGVERGETELERLKASASGNDIRAKSEVARALVAAGRWDEATEAYVWLWKHALEVDPGFTGVRLSFWLMEIAQLVEASVHARSAFEELRAEARKTVDVDPSSLGDWFALNATLGHVDESIGWFDGLKQLPTDEKTIWVIERHLSDELKARGRWADLASLHPKPVQTVNSAFQLLQEATAHVPGPPQMHAEIREFMANNFRTTCTDLFIALHAAGRTTDAHAVHERACTLDPSEEMRMAFDSALDP